MVSVRIGGLVREPVVAQARSLTGSPHVSAGARVAFDRWLAALPLGYWARFTTLETVRLQLSSTAPVDVTVVASDAAGRVRTVASGEAGVAGAPDLVIDVPVSACAGGGWVWPEVQARTEAAEVSFGWYAVGVAPPARSLAVAVPTFDRHDAVLRQLDVLAAALEDGVLDDVVGLVVVIDQGSVPVTDAPGWPQAAARLGDRLRHVRQGNLGGSGGFTRGLVEAFANPTIEHVALIDDDAFPQPEGLASAWAFAQATARPTIVGGHMFDAARPTVLYRLGEVLDRRRFTWTSLSGTPRNCDLADQPVTRHRWMGPAREVDFQPWWLAVVPREAVDSTGLPLPFFLKWDDVEFGLRAGRSGVASVVLPGAAVWHDAWTGKANETTWPAYFLLRNRIVTALLLGHRPWLLAAEWLAVSARHALRREPGALALRRAALQDVLAGPAWLHRDLPTARHRAQEAAVREAVAPHPLSSALSTLAVSGRLVAAWSRLGAAYRSAAREATTLEAWQRTFAQAAEPAGATDAESAAPHPGRVRWSIVVVSYHSLAMLEKYWRGLLDGSGEVEVIIVDNADQPSVEAFARAEGYTYLSMGTNLGLSTANNRGADLARGDYLLVREPRPRGARRRPADAGCGDRPHRWHRHAAPGLPRRHTPECGPRGSRSCWPSSPTAGWPRPARCSATCGPSDPTRAVRCGGWPAEPRRCQPGPSPSWAAGPRSTSSTWRTSSSGSAPGPWGCRCR
ncbi:glycosyltransferase [Nostocoides sp. HKS02]|uniref:glycosyltransferase n=1 Tax=Nostocoides sp. HKS02 TaxID=1813880 RepID=UPI0012B44C02|nr:glycosyltransferase [Tetrasphaera sp. HKS02]QGN56653.1 glycosyltransferase [Tetrasphaera sp. HKS02]